jgi:hypothetical protein
VLFIATVHFKTTKWIDVQRRYLDRNIVAPFKLFGALEGIPDEYRSRFDHAIETKGIHAGKLNLLASEIVKVAEPDDIILFLDGDAFPITDPMPAILHGLESTSLVAVRRDENRGDKQPHPCFCAIRVREWERLHGDWCDGFMWKDSDDRWVSDVGGNLLHALEQSGSEWTPLLRTNKLNEHPVWFAVYGDIVYHHGSGFRRPIARTDEEGHPHYIKGGDLPIVGRAVRIININRRRAWAEVVYQKGERLGEKWFQLLDRDPNFYLKLTQP